MADASDPGCTSVSWSCLGATVSLGALPVPHNLVRWPVLPVFGMCRLCCGTSSPVMCWVSRALRRPGNAAVALCLSTGLQSAEHPWIALPGSVRAPSMPSLGLASPTIEEPADRGKPNPPLYPQTLHLFVELPFFPTLTVDKERLAENFTKRCNLV